MIITFSSNVFPNLLPANHDVEVESDAGIVSYLNLPVSLPPNWNIVQSNGSAGTALAQHALDTYGLALTANDYIVTFNYESDASGNVISGTDGAVRYWIEAQSMYTTESQYTSPAVATAPVMPNSITVAVDENTTDPVGFFTALSGTAPILYTVVGADRYEFDIDGATGELTFLTPPDYEAQTQYNIEVVASNTEDTDFQAVTININNLSDTLPVITGSPVAVDSELGVAYNDPNWTAADEDGPVIGVWSGDTVDINVAGVYVRTFTATNANGSVPRNYTVTVTAAPNNLPTGSVTISDTTPTVGQTLTATNDIADADGIAGGVSYQWMLDGVDISGATNDTLFVQGYYEGQAISVRGSYTDGEGNSESVTSASTALVPSEFPDPVISNLAVTSTGQTSVIFTLDTDTAGTSITYLVSEVAVESRATIENTGETQGVATVGAQTIIATGLTAATDYYVHCLQGNSNILVSSQFTTDAVVVDPDPDPDPEPPVVPSGTLFEQIVNEVYLITNRPDLVMETASAIKSATLKAHKTDYYSKDIHETGIEFDTAEFRQSLDYTQLISNFRSFKYLRKVVDELDDRGMFFDVVTPEETMDGYGVNLTDVAYVAGRVLEIRSSTAFDRALLGCYVYPIVRAEAYESWIARIHPFAIVYESRSCSV